MANGVRDSQRGRCGAVARGGGPRAPRGVGLVDRPHRQLHRRPRAGLHRVHGAGESAACGRGRRAVGRGLLPPAGEVAGERLAQARGAAVARRPRVSGPRRAAEWSEAAGRWCELHAESGFPGICRVHRAEIMRLRGSWSDAESEALHAADELQGFYHIAAGEAFYEIGEIRLRMGDLARAEEVFRQAHELGRDPLPGLALLRLAEGKAEAARVVIDRAVAARPEGSLDRARLLPARVRIA